MLQGFPAVVSYDIRYRSLIYCVLCNFFGDTSTIWWRKGLIPVLAEMFMYAALFLVPMALPWLFY